MIMSGNGPRLFNWGRCVGLLWLAATLPAWAQAPPDGPQPGSAADQKEIDKARSDVEKLRGELEEQARKFRASEDRLRAAAARLNKLEGRSGDVRILIIRDGEHQQGGPGRRNDGDRRGGGDPSRGQPPGGDPRFNPPGGDYRPNPGGDYRRGPDNFQPGPGQGGNRGPGPGGQPGPGGNDQRIQELERKLDHVMRILEEMRRPMPGGGPGGPGPMGPGGSSGPRPMGPGSGNRPPER